LSVIAVDVSTRH